MRRFERASCYLITEFSELEKFSSVFQQWAKIAPMTVFQQWPWMRAYWRAYGQDLSLCSAAVLEDDRLIGILPLVLRGESIEFLGSVESDYNDLLCEPGREAEVLSAALEFLQVQPFGWRAGLLQNLSEHSNIVRSISRLPASARRHIQLVFRSSSPVITIDPERPEMLRALLRKEQFRRAHKKLSKFGSVRFRHLETKDEVRSHLEPFFYQHVTRWAMSGFRSQFLQSPRRAFYEALIEEFDPTKELRFGVLELDSRPLGYHFGFEVDGKLIWYKPTFDVNYWDYSPGDLLLGALFCYAQEAHLKEFDFAGGDEPYKYRFANQIRTNYDVYLEADPFGARARCQRIARHSLGTVRRKPKMKAILNRGIRSIQNAARSTDSLLNGSVLQSCMRKSAAAWRRVMGSRDEIFLFSQARDVAVSDSCANIRPAQLDTLAAISIDYPEIFTEAKLREFRLRLKQGDRSYVVHSGGNEVAVLWIADRSGVTVPDIPRFPDAVQKRPAFVLYDTWVSPEFSAAEFLPGALAELAKQLRGANLWIYCPKEQQNLRLAAEYAGGKPRYTFQGSLSWRGFSIASMVLSL
jgi:CelD/BcsL family acetyltransferase involved in cellulose biosynthesis